MRRSEFHSQRYAGFHRIPQQHLLGSSPSLRPSYNTMDFVRNDTAPIDADSGSVAQAADENMAPTEAHEVRTGKTKKRKKKSGLRTDSVGSANEGATPDAAVIDEAVFVVNSIAAERKERKEEKRRKRHSDNAKEKSHKDGKTSEKKRKRKSQPEVNSGGLESPLGTPIVDDGALHEIKSNSSNDIGEVVQFRDASDNPSKKKIKSHRKSGDLDASIPQVLALSESTPTNEQTKKSKKSKHTPLNTTDAEHLQPQAPASTAVSPYITTPKKTPVPLPQRAPKIQTTTPAPTQATPSTQDTEILVAETPPSKLTSASSKVSKTPVRPMQSYVPTPTVTKLTRDNLMLSRSAVSYIPIKVMHAARKDGITDTSHQPKGSLNDNSISSQRYRRSGSVSSASSMSVKDAFLKIRKPSFTNTDDIDDPFNMSTPPSNHKGSSDRAEKADFDTALLAYRSTVDFIKEQEYVKQFMKRKVDDEEAGPLPCLHQATGCNPSKEKSLSLIRSDNTSNPLPLADWKTSPGSSEVIKRAVAASLAAEKFLANAVLIEMPVPAGNVDGVYSLFCPAYLTHHTDKYASGQRTISISRPSGFKSNTFTARLTLPPRPMAFHVRAFKVPLHASFREITLWLSDEEVAIELVVLGNGYVLLRMDLGLLLTGRKSDRDAKKKEDGSGEGVMMEFYGVKEKDGKGGGAAVEWNAVEEEVRKKVQKEKEKEKKAEAKKPSLKELLGSQSSGGAEGTPTPKKRGRPSKADLERRLLEMEKEMAARGGV